MQREVLAIGANTTVAVCGRGTGKGLLHAATNLRNFQAMPGSTSAIVAANTKRAKINTLPSMFVHWERWGYKRGIHWNVGVKPPKKLGWPKPIYTPDDWENTISFYTGAVGQIISQGVKGTSNSQSFDFIDVDEAKFIDAEQLREETIPANRGQILEFGKYPLHHGMLITSDMPTTKKGSWFLNYESQCDKEEVAAIRALVAEISYLKAKVADSLDNDTEAHRILKKLRGYLARLQQRTTYYGVFSSLENMEVLGEDWVRQQRRNLPPLVFQTSILCIPVGVSSDGFYSSIRPRHRYVAPNTDYLNSLGTLLTPVEDSWQGDGDLQIDAPLCIAFDWNANINWLVCGQPDIAQKRLNVLKSFWVKHERKVPELLDDFDKYYKGFPRREVVFYYDATAIGSNYAVNTEDFRFVVSDTLRKKGWTVREVYIGAPMNHMEKHLLINRGFARRGLLEPYFNEENNQDLLLSIESAGVYNGKKDKRGEKLAETDEDRLESRTDGSDAFDTLFLGCVKFPQRGFSISSAIDL